MSASPPAVWSFPSARIFAGRQVELTPARLETDVPGLFRVAREASIWDYMPCGPFATEAQLAGWLGGWMAAPDTRCFTVRSLSEQRIVGSISVMRIMPAHGVAELGCIWYAPDVQRSAVNTETVHLLLRHLFDDLGYRRVEWKCDDRNKRSKQAALRLGFTFEGLFRRHMVIKGANRDTAWFSMIDEEWPFRRAALERWLYREPGVSLHRHHEAFQGGVIRPATAADLPAIASVLREAADWIADRGQPMWKADELDPARLAEDVERGQFHVAQLGGRVAGTIKFQLEDTQFWPDLPDAQAAYVHRLAVCRDFAGCGLSTALLAWAAGHARSLGRRRLRLDTEASRTGLCALYQRFGFRQHSQRQVGPYFVTRFELELNPVPLLNHPSPLPGETR